MSLIDTYNEFLRTKRSGSKSEARQLADALISEYRTSPDPDFIYAVCEDCDHKVDFIIWKQIILPELSKGLLDNPRCIKGMIRTIQNLYSSKSDWEALDHITEEQLAIRLLQLCPDDQWARGQRVKQLQRWLSYTIHEWPSVILYGSDGASIEECNEILNAVNELRELDIEKGSIALCNEVEDKTIRYKTLLANKAIQSDAFGAADL